MKTRFSIPPRLLYTACLDGLQWLRQQDIYNHKARGSISRCSSLHANVPLGKILEPEFLSKAVCV